MERIVIINESTFTKWMERVKELLSVLHCQEQQQKNKGIGTWLDTSEVCAIPHEEKAASIPSRMFAAFLHCAITFWKNHP